MMEMSFFFQVCIFATANFFSVIHTTTTTTTVLNANVSMQM